MPSRRVRRRALDLPRAAFLLPLVCAASAASIALTPIARANQQGAARAVPSEIDLRPPPGMRSRSLRFAWDGRLDRGMRLPESEYVRYMGDCVKHDNFYGTWELVQLLERAARRVAFRTPGAKLSIGELSRSAGGKIDGHRSHENGRDVDVGYYLTRGDDRPYYTYAFAPIDARGRGKPPNQYLRFDDARNWEMIAKLISDGDARVQYIFVAAYLRQRLLDEAKRRGVSDALIARAKATLVAPSHGNPHNSHFHVRIYCAPADRAVCSDRGPFWPWYPGNPPGGTFTSLSGAPASADL
jgi:penicillin-insensitive murein endopeptidase